MKRASDSRLISEEEYRNIFEAASHGLVIYDIVLDPILGAIRAAHAGRATLPPEAAQALVETANRPPAPSLDLTEHECIIQSLESSPLAESHSALDSEAGE